MEINKHQDLYHAKHSATATRQKKYHHPVCSTRTFDDSNVYGVDSADMQLGWFEPVDNTLFDLE